MNRVGASWSAVLVIVFLGCVGHLYHKFTVGAKTPSNDANLIMVEKSKDEKHYNKNAHLDANLDGLITNAEINRVQEYSVSSEDFDFVESLDYRDRKLLNGLKFEVAKKAIYLSDEAKEKLISMSDIDRITVINNSFNALNSVKEK